MPDLFITCPHCNMQITFGISGGSAEPKESELLGFVFTCPSCHTPVSYQAREDAAVELDQKTFENFQRAMERKISEQERLKGAAFSRRRGSVAAVAKKTIDESIFSNMLKDIRESDSYDEFLRRIGR
ncbi:MAG: hypothetical protein LBB36_03440 [Fibromonadaceae bacterium]|nr:hypothetical protein [Fibromonadaceae bacterium]